MKEKNKERRLIMSNDMKWFILIGTAIFVFILLVAVLTRGIPPSKSDLELAKVACNNQLKEFHYEYMSGNGYIKPRFTCK